MKIDELKIGFLGLLAINVADIQVNWTAVIGLSTIGLQIIRLVLDYKNNKND